MKLLRRIVCSLTEHEEILTGPTMTPWEIIWGWHCIRCGRIHWLSVPRDMTLADLKDIIFEDDEEWRE